jgi:dethiobiotin synthetase
MNIKFSCFVTGTDTDVGKTLVASALLHKCRQQGWRAVGMKPVAAGCQPDAAGQMRNADVEALRQAGNVDAAQGEINPYLFQAAIAPHLAAQQQGVTIDPEHILSSLARLRAQAEAIVVEGAGGFRIPLTAGCDSADLARRMGLPVVLVVGMRLGCLNHALLTQEAIAVRGLSLAGWVANRVDPAMECFDENLASLQALLQAPLLGVLPFMPVPDPHVAAACLVLPEICNHA